MESRTLVLGAGFAGLELATILSERMGDEAGVTLIDAGDSFVFGFAKSIAFAIMIGLTSCRIGLLAGRSAADVGVAATKAVVVGIVGIIAMDAVFAVIADVIGI